jgi:putative transcriptional regulator
MMIAINIKNILKTKNKSKYWLVKNMGGGYQAISRLMNNETTGIYFETLEKLCEILECTPGDILTLEERKKK